MPVKNKLSISFIFSYFSAYCLILSTHLLFAQSTQRGIGKVAREADSEKGKYYLLAIGIDKYDHWMVLKNAVNDAKGFTDVMTESFGFLTPSAPLYNNEATRKNILKAFDELRKVIKKEDNLIIFFAGHGHTRIDTVGNKVVETGYIIPSDADEAEEADWSSYIGLDLFLNRSALLPCKHITVVLDACHSGVALGNAAGRFRSSSEYTSAFHGKISRRVITSARRNQLAKDNGPIPKHSLFTGILIEGLKSGKADLDGNGIITTSELGLFLEQHVNKESEGLQTPDFGTFFLDDRGEMLLSLDEVPTTLLLNNARMLYNNGKIKEFAIVYNSLKQRQLPLSQFYDLKLTYSLLMGDINTVIKTLDGLLELEGILDKSILYNAMKFRPLFQHWEKYLENMVPMKDVAVEIKVNGNTFDKAEHYLEVSKMVKLPSDCIFEFGITNTSDQPIYIYAFHSDFKASFEILNPWIENEIFYGDGLAPGATINSHKLKHSRISGTEAIKFVFSSQPIPEFLSPPDFLMAEINVLEPKPDLKSLGFLLVFKDELE